MHVERGADAHGARRGCSWSAAPRISLEGACALLCFLGCALRTTVILPYIRHSGLPSCICCYLTAPLHALQVAYDVRLQAKHVLGKCNSKPGANVVSSIVRHFASNS